MISHTAAVTQEIIAKKVVWRTLFVFCVTRDGLKIRANFAKSAFFDKLRPKNTLSVILRTRSYPRRPCSSGVQNVTI